MIITLAVAVTGITVPADKTKAETVPETTEAPRPSDVTEAPAQTPAPGATPKPVKGMLLVAGDGTTYIGTGTEWVPYVSPAPAPTATLRPAPAPTATPTWPTPEPVKKADGVFVEEKGAFWWHEADETIAITKGFETKIELPVYAREGIKWTSSNPDVISVKSTGDDGIATLKAKKYGKAVLTAEYSGQTTSITFKSSKNEWANKNRWQLVHDNQSLKIMRWEAIGAVSAKYDKKGNIVVKYEERQKWTKYGKKIAKKYNILWKRSTYHISWKKSPKVKVLYRGKTIAKYHSKTRKNEKELTHADPVYKRTFTIPKKYIKKKNKIDLRKCTFEAER